MSIDGIRFKTPGSEILKWLEADRDFLQKGVDDLGVQLQAMEFMDWTGDMNPAEKKLQDIQAYATSSMFGGILGVQAPGFNLAQSAAKRKELCVKHYRGAQELGRHKVELQDWMIAHIAPSESFLLTEADLGRLYFKKSTDAVDGLKSISQQMYA